MKLSQGLWHKSYKLVAQTGLPTAFFRHVIRTCRVGIGSRCRVEGFSDDSIAEYLTWLGFDVVEDGSSHDASRDDVNTGCDLVIVPMSCSAAHSLLEGGILRRTADYLASLKPAGFLVFVSERANEFDLPRHQPDCYRRQLNVFPGDCHVHEHRPGLLRSLARRSGVANGPAGYQTVMLQTPADAMSRVEWESIAQRAATGGRSLCCDLAAFERPSAELRDAA